MRVEILLFELRVINKSSRNIKEYILELYINIGESFGKLKCTLLKLRLFSKVS